MRERFGPFLADGGEANAFRTSEVEVLLIAGEKVVLDFAGVENMTDSFANALFANVARYHLPEVMAHLRFQGCAPGVKEFIRAGLTRGSLEAQRDQAATAAV